MDPGFFVGGGAPVRNGVTDFFFCRIPVVLKSRATSQGEGGAHPLHPPPRSAPELHQKTARIISDLFSNFFQLHLLALNFLSLSVVKYLNIVIPLLMVKYIIVDFSLI